MSCPISDRFGLIATCFQIVVVRRDANWNVEATCVKNKWPFPVFRRCDVLLTILRYLSLSMTARATFIM